MVLNSNTLDFLWLKDGDQGTPGADGSSLYTWVKYSPAADGSHMTDDPTDAVYIGIAYNKASAIESSDPRDYNWTLIKGDNGNDGQDAYTIILTNENISFSTDRTNLPLTNQSTTCNIIVYQGVTPITTFSIGTVTAPTGIGITKTTNSVTASVSNSVYVPNDNGMIQIPITIGNITVTKQIAYSLSKQGENGRGIASTVVEYQASNDGTRPPENDEWTSYIPSMRPSQFLWTRTRVTYTDGTTIDSFTVGKEGKGIATVTNEYKISIDNTDPYAGRSDGTTSDWSAVRPNDLKTDEYLWIRYVYTYDDGSVAYSDEIYDSTIDGISSILDTENRTIKDTVWETAYMNVVDPDTGEVVRMNIKNTIVTSLTDITGIEQRVSTAEQNLGDFTNNEYTLFKQSVDSFKTEVTDNIANATTIAIQTAEDFSWLFSKTVYDAYLVDDDGNYILDENGDYIKAEKDSLDDSTRISFTRNGMKMVNGIIEVKAPDGETTIIEGGKINTNRIASLDGTSWINLGLGTFNYGDKLIWDGATLMIDGDVRANTGYIGGEDGWIIDTQRIYNGVHVGEGDSTFLSTTGLGSATIAGHFDTDWRITNGSFFGATSNGLFIGNTDTYLWFNDGTLSINTGGDSLFGAIEDLDDKYEALNGNIDGIQSRINAFSGLDEDFINFYTSLREQYINFNSYDGLIIGTVRTSTQTQQFATQIKGEGINFLQNGKAVAYITGNRFHINSGEIEQNGFLRIGNFVIAPDPDGSLGFRYSPLPTQQSSQSSQGGD